MFTTITTRRPCVCKRCGQAIPVGTRIRYGGQDNCYHLAHDCPAKTTTRAPIDYRMRQANDDTLSASLHDIERARQHAPYR